MEINKQKIKNKEESCFDVVLGFDMETDIGSYTPYYEGVQHGTPEILSILKKYGIKASFFWIIS